MKKNALTILVLFWIMFISFNLLAQDENSAQHSIPDCLYVVETMPAYPGGQSALLKFINDSLQLTSISLDQLQSSQVVIRFVVERDGNVSSLKVIKSIHPEIDAAYLRVFEKMPAWIPGRQRGIPIRTQMNFPIRIHWQ